MNGSPSDKNVARRPPPEREEDEAQEYENELVALFVSMVSCNEQQQADAIALSEAIFFLEMCEGNLEKAAAMYREQHPVVKPGAVFYKNDDTNDDSYHNVILDPPPGNRNSNSGSSSNNGSSSLLHRSAGSLQPGDLQSPGHRQRATMTAAHSKISTGHLFPAEPGLVQRTRASAPSHHSYPHVPFAPDPNMFATPCTGTEGSRPPGISDDDYVAIIRAMQEAPLQNHTADTQQQHRLYHSLPSGVVLEPNNLLANHAPLAAVLRTFVDPRERSLRSSATTTTSAKSEPTQLVGAIRIHANHATVLHPQQAKSDRQPPTTQSSPAKTTSPPSQDVASLRGETDNTTNTLQLPHLPQPQQQQQQNQIEERRPLLDFENYFASSPCTNHPSSSPSPCSNAYSIPPVLAPTESTCSSVLTNTDDADYLADHPQQHRASFRSSMASACPAVNEDGGLQVEPEEEVEAIIPTGTTINSSGDHDNFPTTPHPVTPPTIDLKPPPPPSQSAEDSAHQQEPHKPPRQSEIVTSERVLSEPTHKGQRYRSRATQPGVVRVAMADQQFRRMATVPPARIVGQAQRRHCRRHNHHHVVEEKHGGPPQTLSTMPSSSIQKDTADIHSGTVNIRTSPEEECPEQLVTTTPAVAAASTLEAPVNSATAPTENGACPTAGVFLGDVHAISGEGEHADEPDPISSAENTASAIASTAAIRHAVEDDEHPNSEEPAANPFATAELPHEAKSMSANTAAVSTFKAARRISEHGDHPVTPPPTQNGPRCVQTVPTDAAKPADAGSPCAHDGVRRTLSNPHEATTAVSTSIEKCVHRTAALVAGSVRVSASNFAEEPKSPPGCSNSHASHGEIIMVPTMQEIASLKKKCRGIAAVRPGVVHVTCNGEVEAPLMAPPSTTSVVVEPTRKTHSKKSRLGQAATRPGAVFVSASVETDCEAEAGRTQIATPTEVCTQELDSDDLVPAEHVPSSGESFDIIGVESPSLVATDSAKAASSVPSPVRFLPRAAPATLNLYRDMPFEPLSDDDEDIDNSYACDANKNDDLESGSPSPNEIHNKSKVRAPEHPISEKKGKGLRRLYPAQRPGAVSVVPSSAPEVEEPMPDGAGHIGANLRGSGLGAMLRGLGRGKRATKDTCELTRFPAR